MLRNASATNGYAIAATDGPLGSVSDFLFDDAGWQVRWLVVDTGNWLPGRKVLLPTSVLGHLDAEHREFAVRLTMKQVEDSPDINADRPVSRQMETSVYDYYGWRPYWGSGFYMGGYGYMGGLGSMDGAMMVPPPSSDVRGREEQAAQFQRTDEDPHLRSVNAVTGYYIKATDGEIGHVNDVLIEDADWTIHYIVVDTMNWWAGKKVLISPRSVTDIAWRDNLRNLAVNRQAVRNSPLYDPTMTIDRTYERNFHDYYRGLGPTDRL